MYCNVILRIFGQFLIILFICVIQLFKIVFSQITIRVCSTYGAETYDDIPVDTYCDTCDDETYDATPFHTCGITFSDKTYGDYADVDTETDFNETPFPQAR